MFNVRILVATDGSALSDKAVAMAVNLARALRSELVAFTALPVYQYAGIGESSGVAAEDYHGRVGAEARTAWRRSDWDPPAEGRFGAGARNL
ncbi:MAG: universal stress protein [Burkholderiaceae bacterium]